MSVLRNIVKTGASFTAGVLAGKYLFSEEPEYDNNIWSGETGTWKIKQEDAEKELALVVGWLNYDWENYRFAQDESKVGVHKKGMPPFWRDDLKNIEINLSHRLAQADEDEWIETEITDRQRLLMFDLSFGGPPMKEVREIGYEYLDIDENSS